MKKTQLLILLFLTCIGASAASLPTTSTESNPVWYFVKFMNGGAVLESKGSNAKVATASMSGAEAQLWRFEGDNTTGYTIVSKSGMKLYTNNTNTNGMFYSAAAPGSNTSFSINPCSLGGYTEGFVISPKANNGVYMNQWGGAGAGKELGLWNAVDNNCPLTFVTEAEYEAELKKASLPLIPMPTDMTIGEGSVKMASLTTIAYPSEEYKALAEQFADFLGKISKQTISVAQTTTATAGTILLSKSSETNEEAYTLNVKDGSVVITAGKAHGFFNGLTTLRQLYYGAVYGEKADGEVPCVSISDQPRFGYRGFMLDIARHYFDKTEVKKILDVMALYKISKFHWHLTDDQGWRIDIPEYPRLIEVGAIREQSNTKTSPRFYDDTEYGRGMYYTLDDLKEIVDYAAKLHIDIMPEIDLPGHMVAAIASYPDELSCNPKQAIENNGEYKVRINEGISKDVLNVAKPEVMEFLKCVLKHMAEVFPYPIIHIGGDECPTQAWQLRVDAKDKQFTDWMAANKLTNVNQIQPWLVNELGQWLKAEYGKDVVCWNELTNHWDKSLETQPIIMCYSDNGKNAMKAAANLDMRTIYTGCWPFYLDMYQTYDGQHQFDEPYTGGYGNNTLQAVYEATPTSSISDKEELCLGVGANLWTETVCNNKEAEHQFFPRMLALAEVGWLPEKQKSWVSFRKRVQTHFKVMDEFSVNYATYDLDVPELEVIDTARQEAQRLLQDAQPDAVGYPSAGTYAALTQALNAEETNDYTSKLEAAITAFKQAPVTQPAEGKTYRVISGSVAWGRDYTGSAMYVTTDKKYRFHYTQQTEPEELFEFIPYNEGYRMVSRLGDRRVYLPSLNAQVTASTTATVVRIDAASVQSTNPNYYDYVPGLVTISAKSGYSVNGSSCKRLNAQNDGYVYVKSDATVGHTGCWRIVEVTDFSAELRGLVNKCSRLGILTNEIVTPATTDLENKPTISQEEYEAYLALYAEKMGLKFIPTGISSLRTASTTTATYDLQGRPTATKNGISVSDSKKFLHHKN
ncbi:MAG: beta-N-acetylhexosaminidase [Bacteroidaceae bacterium]|nr:beta-N-acetylhexosaminidase [Bacteroidaceae bacterium]